LGADMFALELSPDDRSVLFLSNAPGRGGRRQLNLWRVPADGGTPSQLTEYAFPVGFGGLAGHSPDGRSIAYSANESEDLKNADIYVARSDGSSPERVLRVREGSVDGPASWHPDGHRIAVNSDATGTQRPGILDLGTREIRWLGKDGEDESVVEFSPDGRRLLTLRHHGVQIDPHVYDVDSGEGQRLPLDGGVTLRLAFAKDNDSVFCAFSSPTRRPEFVLLRPGQPTTVLRAADYGSIDPTRFANCRVVRYLAPDGRSIEALLYSPPHIAAGARLPALVEVHGGPTAQFFRNFNTLAQCLVSRGIVLLQPNIRGSTGYGSEFRDLNRNDWGGADLSDVVAGAEYLAGLPFVDPTRVGVWGGSFGGFMTYLATVKRPELWKAACAWVGISDLERLYDESREHYQYYFREQMGEPQKNRELWRDRSAIHFADRLTAHLLMAHGVNDPRCPVDQARLFRDRLVELGRKEGKDFEYLELTDEGHGSADIEEKLRMYRTLSDFFARAL
ncbi:MAG: S9 family peptidase, partial [Thermoplasmata archaeon]|nr:S9 family peptidase [Thermoplasmata archaeon]